MLISQQARSKSRRRQGSGRVNFAELRRELATPTAASDSQRQRLLDLARRLSRVQAMGDEYARVGMSEHFQQALKQI